VVDLNIRGRKLKIVGVTRYKWQNYDLQHYSIKVATELGYKAGTYPDSREYWNRGREGKRFAPTP